MLAVQLFFLKSLVLKQLILGGCFVFTGASTFHEAMRMGAEVYQMLKKVVKENYGIDGRCYPGICSK